LVAAFSFVATAAHGDSIRIGSVQYSDVLVVKVSSGYHVMVPRTGETIIAAFENVDPDSVVVEEDASVRSELRATFQKNKRLNDQERDEARLSDAAVSEDSVTMPAGEDAGQLSEDKARFKIGGSNITFLRGTPTQQEYGWEEFRDPDNIKLGVDESRKEGRFQRGPVSFAVVKELRGDLPMPGVLRLLGRKPDEEESIRGPSQGVLITSTSIDGFGAYSDFEAIPGRHKARELTWRWRRNGVLETLTLRFSVTRDDDNRARSPGLQKVRRKDDELGVIDRVGGLRGIVWRETDEQSGRYIERVYNLTPFHGTMSKTRSKMARSEDEVAWLKAEKRLSDLRKGMTYDSVSKLFGIAGTPDRLRRIGNAKLESFYFYLDDSTAIQAEFENDRLRDWEPESLYPPRTNSTACWDCDKYEIPDFNSPDR